MSDDDIELAAEVAAVAHRVPGVVALYPAGTLTAAAIRHMAALAAAGDTEAAKIAIVRDDAGLPTIGVKIGVDAAYPVPDTLRAVATAIRTYLIEFAVGDEVPVVEVTVGTIDEPVETI